MRRAKRTRNKLKRRREPAWTKLSDEDLLKLRFCDLRLSLNASFIARHVAKLHAELEQRGIKFRPHVWLSEEWFSPDGIPGIAIPFFLAHPRLMQLERRLMHEVEGGNFRWFMRILRHETGHALDNAFRLRRRKDWRAVFGKASRAYPNVYRPRPASRKFVLHLGHWYAQSHPTEDFAETFAVWLQPRSRWRSVYHDWPALKKLEFVDRTMRGLAGVLPPVREREVAYPLSENRRTLGEHYRRKLRSYAVERVDAYDEKLLRVFKPHERLPHRPRLAPFLRQSRPQLLRLLIRRTRLHSYLIHHVVRTVIRRCRQLDLVMDCSQREAKRLALVMMERIINDILRRDREKYVL